MYEDITFNDVKAMCNENGCVILKKEQWEEICNEANHIIAVLNDEKVNIQEIESALSVIMNTIQ